MAHQLQTTDFANPSTGGEHGVDQLEYLLRRAEQEAIAAIRSPDPAAAGSHSYMASIYSARALTILADAPDAAVSR